MQKSERKVLSLGLKSTTRYEKNPEKFLFADVLGSYLKTQYGDEYYRKTRESLKSIEKLRDSFDFITLERQMEKDYKALLPVLPQMEQYIINLYIIREIFKEGFSNGKCIDLPIIWGCLSKPYNTKKGSHINYELCCFLYNYASSLYFLAMKTPNDPEFTLLKLRNALWCLEEVRNLLPNIGININELPDMDTDFQDSLLSFIKGFICLSLFHIQSKQGENSDYIKAHAGSYFAQAAEKFSQIKNPFLPPSKKKDFEEIFKNYTASYPIQNISQELDNSLIVPIKPKELQEYQIPNILKDLVPNELFRKVNKSMTKIEIAEAKLQYLSDSIKKLSMNPYLQWIKNHLNNIKQVPESLKSKINAYKPPKSIRFAGIRQYLEDFHRNSDQAIKQIIDLLGTENYDDKEFRERYNIIKKSRRSRSLKRPTKNS